MKAVKKKKRITKIVVAITIIQILVLLGFAVISFLLLFDKEAPSIKNITIKDLKDETVTIKIKLSKEKFNRIYCGISETLKDDINYTLARNNTCEFIDLDRNKNYYVYLKDSSDNLQYYKLNDYLKNNVLEIKTEDEIYLLKNETTDLNYEIESIFEFSDYENIKIINNNTDIVTITDNKITGKENGTSSITLKYKDIETTINVIVTSLINPKKIRNDRPFIKCHQYTKEEAETLDKLLEYRIKQAGGYGTRGAVVAAIRFLLLEFPYRINYFPENGRLDNYQGNYIADGEGRYYHRGLYLHEDKFSSIKASQSGPAIWGCPLQIVLGEVDQPAGSYYPNGLDCSGFISWVLYNGGYNVKDLSAGFNSQEDLSDLGVKEDLTLDLLKSGRIKAGDLIGLDGHIAMVVGIDENNIYVGEALHYDVGTTVRIFTHQSILYYNYYTYIIPMDNYYKKEGIYNNMW